MLFAGLLVEMCSNCVQIWDQQNQFASNSLQCHVSLFFELVEVYYDVSDPERDPDSFRRHRSDLRCFL